jgi:hypothetical protein
MMQAYPAEIEQIMQRLYRCLSEKDRRRYAAVEALKLGWGGKSYISRLFGCDDESMQLGLSELNDETVLKMSRIRRPGGGRPRALDSIEGLDDAFLRVVAQHNADVTTDEPGKWTTLSRQEIVQLLRQEGIQVSVTVVKQLLDRHHYRNYRKRKAQKRLTTSAQPERNDQSGGN